MNALVKNGASCGEASWELECHLTPSTFSTCQKAGHTEATTVSQERPEQGNQGSLHHAKNSSSEFDLVDIVFDDDDIVSHGTSPHPVVTEYSPRLEDKLMHVLLKAKNLSQPKVWTFVRYTAEEIATWGPDCYKNERNFERHNYWYPNRPTLPTLVDQVLDLLPKLENGNLDSESDNSLGLSDISIDMEGSHWLSIKRPLEVRTWYRRATGQGTGCLILCET